MTVHESPWKQTTYADNRSDKEKKVLKKTP